MKVLLLNQVFFPDVVATAQHLTDLARALAERGHEVTVVAGRQAYSDSRIVFQKRERWQGIEIYRVRLTSLPKTSRLGRAINFASFVAACSARLALVPRHDVVVALTTPPLISFIGSITARRWHAGFIYWVMDLNPDEAIAAGWLKKSSIVSRLLEWMSRFSLHRCHQAVVLDHFMKERLLGKGVAEEKIAVIPPWPHQDQVRFEPDGRRQFRALHGLAGKFVVMYSGNHSPIHPLDTLLEASEHLRHEPDICFCFVGGGSEFERIQRWARARPYLNIVLLPYQPLESLGASLSAADAHVVVMGDPFVGTVHPCKIYNILAIGAPILYIGPYPSHVTDVMEKLGPGYPCANVRHGDSRHLAESILQMKRTQVEDRGHSIRMVSHIDSQQALTNQLVSVIEQRTPRGLDKKAVRSERSRMGGSWRNQIEG
jgi:glycosyltransferase involved in cell wall biosynthesis